tara:strand:+ start:2392 stop:2778 length:387 start_codon:yes stop_codon:yes gene_type:complete
MKIDKTNYFFAFYQIKINDFGVIESEILEVVSFAEQQIYLVQKTPCFFSIIYLKQDSEIKETKQKLEANTIKEIQKFYPDFVEYEKNERFTHTQNYYIDDRKTVERIYKEMNNNTKFNFLHLPNIKTK